MNLPWRRFWFFWGEGKTRLHCTGTAVLNNWCSPTTWLSAGLAVLAIGAVVVLILACRPPAEETRRNEEFQRLVGGLGFGPAISVKRCEQGFDPRLCPCCTHAVGPIPGGAVLCPYHASAVFDY